MKKIVGILVICFIISITIGIAHGSDNAVTIIDAAFEGVDTLPRDDAHTGRKKVARAMNEALDPHNIRPDFNKDVFFNICEAIPKSDGSNDVAFGDSFYGEAKKELPPYGSVEITPELSYCYLVKACNEHTDHSYWDLEYEKCLDEFGIPFNRFY